MTDRSRDAALRRGFSRVHRAGGLSVAGGFPARLPAVTGRHGGFSCAAEEAVAAAEEIFEKPEQAERAVKNLGEKLLEEFIVVALVGAAAEMASAFSEMAKVMEALVFPFFTQRKSSCCE